jgi:hypothetical protein
MTHIIRRIAVLTAEEAGIHPGLMFRMAQDRDGRRWRGSCRIARVRQLAMWIARRYAPPAVVSLQEIGRRLGGRCHLTVRYGIARIEADLAHDTELQAIRDRVLTRLGAEPVPKPAPVPPPAPVQAPRQIAVRVKVRSLVPPMPASEVMRRRMERAYPGGKGTEDVA